MSQQPRNLLIIDDRVNNLHLEIPGFTCKHCNKAFAPNVTSTSDPVEIDKRIAAWFDSKTIDRNCDGLLCTLCAAVWAQNGYSCAGLRFEEDVQRAFRDELNQPWLLRDARHEPVYRLYNAQGEPMLVARKDVGLTETQLKEIMHE